MIGLALSGGGSRAMAFHLGCLRALNDLGILDRVAILSAISGGSLIGAYFAYSPQKTFSEFDSDVCQLLRNGFHRSIVLEMVKPKNLLHGGRNKIAIKLNTLLAYIQKTEPRLQRYPSRTDIFHSVLQRDLFSGLKMNSPRRHNIEVVIGSCDLRTGSSFRFGNCKSGNGRYGEMIEWNVEVGFAAAASAAYPIFLPALDRTWTFKNNGIETEHRVLLTDGGVYDNLGLQVLEPNREKNKSLHTFPCEYLIVCNAGHGQESGSALPLSYLSRVSRSFEIVHRRVQDSAMRRLHHMKEAGMIKGFILPYLGQQDDILPLKPAELVPRSEVVNYPTNFAAMDNHWIEKLAGRGEQLTRTLVESYLTEVL